MHYTQLLALLAATATTIAALPLQLNEESSAPLGKRFYYTHYIDDDGVSSASGPPPFGYDQYQGSLAKRFYYTRYVADDDINSENYGPGLAKRFYYTHYIDDESIDSASQDPPPFGYDQYQGSSLAKRFYYTRYVADDEINSADEENYGHGLAKRFYYTDYVDDESVKSASQDPPPFGYDQYQASNPNKEANIVSHGQQPCDEHISHGGSTY